MAQKFIAALIGLGLILATAAEADPYERAAFAWSLIEERGALLVDLRDRRPFEDEHIAGAINIPLTDIVSGSVDFGPDKKRFLVLYGEEGFRVSDVDALLAKTGYTNGFFAGGYETFGKSQRYR